MESKSPSETGSFPPTQSPYNSTNTSSESNALKYTYIFQSNPLAIPKEKKSFFRSIINLLNDSFYSILKKGIIAFFLLAGCYCISLYNNPNENKILKGYIFDQETEHPIDNHLAYIYIDGVTKPIEVKTNAQGLFETNLKFKKYDSRKIFITTKQTNKYPSVDMPYEIPIDDSETHEIKYSIKSWK